MKEATKYYFDTSALLPYYREEATSEKIQQLLMELEPPVLISSLTIVEVASALSRLVRMGEILDQDANRIETTLKADIKQGLFLKQPISTNNFKQAEKWLFARNTSLRTLDALHLSFAWFQKAVLVTSDTILKKSAVAVGIKTYAP